MALEQVKMALEKNGFAVSVFETAEEAAAYLNREIDGVSVGFGGSVTMEAMGLYESLGSHNSVYWHWREKDIFAAAASADVYLLSPNAIAENTGELINIDGTGNRVSSALFGHKKVYFIAGKNKVSPDFDSALHRARNVVAPQNAQRLKLKTPCAVKGDRCYNCNSPDRICCGLVVHYKKMKSMDMEVVLINEELGY